MFTLKLNCTNSFHARDLVQLHKCLVGHACPGLGFKSVSCGPAFIEHTRWVLSAHSCPALHLSALCVYVCKSWCSTKTLELLVSCASLDLDSILNSRDIILPTKVHLVKAMVFPVVMYGCESWTIKKAECQIMDAFELWCWRRLLRFS